MNTLAMHCWSQVALLAASPFGRGRSNVDTTTLVIFLGGAVLVIALISVGAVLGHRAAHKWRHNSQAGLFHGLCKLHELSRAERNLLSQVGRARNVKLAGQVFIDPSLLNPKKLPPALRDKQKPIAALYKKLFG